MRTRIKVLLGTFALAAAFGGASVAQASPGTGFVYTTTVSTTAVTTTSAVPVPTTLGGIHVQLMSLSDGR